MQIGLITLTLPSKNLKTPKRLKLEKRLDRTTERRRERMTEGLSEDERKALRGSKFAPLPPPPFRSQQPRLAHPGGPLRTNKAAALAKFIERKLQDPNGLASIDPDILELAVKNAKDTVLTSGTSKSGTIIHHVTDFGDSEESFEEDEVEKSSLKRRKGKNKKKGKKNNKQKIVDDSECANLKKRKKKLKL